MKKLTKIWLLLATMATWGSDPQVMGQATFQKTYGPGTATCIKKTSDNNLILTAGGLLKIDQDGNQFWHKGYSVSGGMDMNAVEQTSDGGFIVAGTWATGPVSKMALLKTDSNGNPQWARTYGGSMYDEGYDVKQTLDGGYISVGLTTSFGTVFADIYIIKTDNNGNLQWSKYIRYVSCDCFDIGYSIVQSGDSSYIVCGRVGNILTNSKDAGLIKLDKAGNFQWAKCYGGTGDDQGYSLIATSDGGYAIAGYTQVSGPTDQGAYVIKVDSNGNLNWSRKFGSYNAWGEFVDEMTDGSYFLSGYAFLSGNSIIGIKLDVNGDTLWTKYYDGGQYALGYAAENIGNNYFSAGIYGSNNDIYIIKTDSVGNSGCFEGNPNLAVTTPLTTVTTPSVTVSSPATVVNSISFTTFGVSTVNSLCSLVSVPEVRNDQFITDDMRLADIYDMFGRKVSQTYPGNIYIYQYVDKYGRSFFRKMLKVELY